MIQQYHSLGYTQRNVSQVSVKGTCTTMFTAALLTIAKLWKQPRCPTTDEWIKKWWYLYIVQSSFISFNRVSQFFLKRS
jgi:hypothetical protein